MTKYTDKIEQYIKRLEVSREFDLFNNMILNMRNSDLCKDLRKKDSEIAILKNRIEKRNVD